MNTDFLKETRKRKGLTQGDIAHALGMKTPSWFKIEKGQNNLHPRHWKKVASILGVTEDEISDFAACVAVDFYQRLWKPYEIYMVAHGHWQKEKEEETPLTRMLNRNRPNKTGCLFPIVIGCLIIAAVSFV